jgi:hypothetical protein
VRVGLGGAQGVVIERPPATHDALPKVLVITPWRRRAEIGRGIRGKRKVPCRGVGVDRRLGVRVRVTARIWQGMQLVLSGLLVVSRCVLPEMSLWMGDIIGLLEWRRAQWGEGGVVMLYVKFT